MDKKQFERFYLYLLTLYPNVTRLKSDTTKRMWERQAAAFEYKDCMDALDAFGHTHKLPPDPADILSGLSSPGKDLAHDERAERLAEDQILQNVRTACAIMGWAMPEGMTSKQAVTWAKGIVEARQSAEV